MENQKAKSVEEVKENPDKLLYFPVFDESKEYIKITSNGIDFYDENGKLLYHYGK